MLVSFSAGVEYQRGDVNYDGRVSISDVTCLVDYLLNGTWNDEPQTEVFTVNGVSFNMVSVEGGTFMMGAPDDDWEANDNEKPAHQVTLSDYCIGETEVTQALWLAVMGSNPSHFSPTNGYAENLQRPVENVSWYDCRTFINKLNEMTGKQFRLPSEAEWEYAARGGKRSQGYKYAGSNDVDAVAWYSDNIPSSTEGTAGYGTQPVATKSPNELGLYDMSGNVWEWCQDWFGSYSGEPQTNPTGPVLDNYPTNFRVMRGCGWTGLPRACRVSYRSSDSPDYDLYIFGLRLAL